MTEDMMQKQMNELAALCQRFNDAITGIGKNQQEISEHIKGQDSKIEEMALKMNVGPETIQANSTRNPAAIKENNPSPSFSGAIKTVQNWYEGNPQEWFAFKRKIKNLTWALNLSKIESIKLIKMALTGPAIFIADNVDQERFMNDMNGDGGVEGYLLALENLFVGKAASDINRTKFAMAHQLRNETIPLFASRIVALFTNAFPNEEEPNKHLLVIDRFISGIKDEEQKKFVLQQKEKDDHLSKIMDLALKYESVNTIMNPKLASTSLNRASFNNTNTANNINSINYRRRSFNNRSASAKPFFRRPFTNFNSNFGSSQNFNNYRNPSSTYTNNYNNYQTKNYPRANGFRRNFTRPISSNGYVPSNRRPFIRNNNNYKPKQNRRNPSKSNFSHKKGNINTIEED